MEDFEKISIELKSATEKSQRKTEEIFAKSGVDLFGYTEKEPTELFFELREAISAASEAFSRAFTYFSSKKAEDDLYIHASGLCADACDGAIGGFLAFCSEKLLNENENNENKKKTFVADIQTRAKSTFALLFALCEKISEL